MKEPANELPLAIGWREFLQRRIEVPPARRPKPRRLKFPFELGSRTRRLEVKHLRRSEAKSLKKSAKSAAQGNQISNDFDAMVVGSGYGGSVAALRLAEKGYRVLLLERGGEYLPGDFANDWSMLPKYLRVNVPGQPLPLGRASGLIEMTVGQGMAAVTSNGLGGGSLINAGVVIRPDEDVFSQDAWPASIRYAMGSQASESELSAAFRTAELELGAAAYAPPVAGQLKKTSALQRLGKSLGEESFSVNLTMDFNKCIQCGNCAAGCNVPNAKKDLRSTYLQKALDTKRVQIVTQAEVYRFADSLQDPADPTQPRKRWKLWVFSTGAQHDKASRQEAGHESDMAADPASTLRVLSTDLLVISAGTLGSTQLLQRSQALAGDGLSFSPALGTRLSGNGDSISVLMEPDTAVEAVACGVSKNLSDHPTEKQTGPTITRMIDLRKMPKSGDNGTEADPRKPLENRLLMQDAAIPGAMSRIFEELVATVQTLAQTERWSFQGPDALAKEDGKSDSLAASSEMARRAQILLTMGHDGSPGRMIWMPSTDSSAMVMPAPEDLATYKEQQKLFERMKGLGLHLQNPLWQALPNTAMDLMSGTSPPRMLTTVHPLGGCPMGDDPSNSVVNHMGQVWMHDPGYPGRQPPGATGLNAPPPNSPTGYPGLYVLDGSVIPTSLGCNPLLTITAIAERAMKLALAELPSNTRQCLGSALRNPKRPLVALAHTPVPLDAHLSETLRASSGTFKGSWADLARRELVLSATLSTQDIEKTLKKQKHPFKISAAQLTVGARGSDDQFIHEADYELDCERATFHFLQATSSSSGYGPLWQAIGSTAVLFALLFVLPFCAYVALGSQWFADHSPVVVNPATTVLRVSISALIWVLIWPLALFCLPFLRTFLTWLFLRGWMDIKLGAFKGEGSIKMLRSGFRQMMHSLEKRQMAYHLPMKRMRAKELDVFPETIVLSATKTVVYRASMGEMRLWLWRKLKRWALKTTTEIPPLRPSYWEQLMDAEAKIRDRHWVGRFTPDLFNGRLRMGFENLFSHQAAQMGERGDTTTGLLMLSGYALLAVRFAIKTRLYDFRLPTYSKLPLADRASSADLEVRWAPNPKALANFVVVQPELHTVQVLRGHSSSDAGDEHGEDLQLRLWRYRREKGKEPQVPNFCDAPAWSDSAVSVRKVKSVLLLHAFGQSGQTYTFKAKDSQSGSNLAEAFYNRGYEVWVLDSRMSSRSGHAEQAMTVDMLGQHDVPGAVDHILKTLGKDLFVEGSPPAPLQIAVFAQCIGAASLWMAALSGRLNHQGTQASKVSIAMFSQVHALTHGTPMTRAKVWLPAFLQKFLSHVPFAVRGPQESGLWQAMDRIFSSLPTPEAERKLHWNDDASATCRRIRFIESPLFLHENMDADAVRNMPLLFGPASLRLFAHARRFVEHGRVVDEDGMNRYVTDHNLDKTLLFPIGLLHGERNELFAVSGAHDTRDWLMRHPRYAQLPPKLLIVKNHGHLDVLLGKSARTGVFNPVLAFFDQGWCEPPLVALVDGEPKEQSNDLPNGCQITTPKVGPLLGWVYKTQTHWIVRWSIMLDDIHTSDTTRVLVRHRSQGGAYESILAEAEVSFHSMATPVEPATYPQHPTYLHFATVEAKVPIDLVFLATDPVQALNFQTIVLHASLPFGGVAPQVPWPPQLSDSQIDQALAKLREEVVAHNQTARLKSLPEMRSVDEHITCSVPAATCTALAKDPPTKVEFLAACCRHPGLSVDKSRLDAQLPHSTGQAAFSLLVGDQIYADATAGLIDPTSPIERYLERHETAFTTPDMRRFLAHIPTLMTPDDHEWTNEFPLAAPLFKWSWPDWRGDSAFGEREKRWYEWANDAVLHFQKLQWPTPAHGGRWTDAGPIGPIRIFVMDSRQDRKRSTAHVVKPGTLSDLKTWLANGSADFLNVVVSGSVALPGLYPDTDPSNPGPMDSWQHAPAQRLRLIDMLVSHSTVHKHRFMLISGDYHLSAAFSVHSGQETVGAAVLVPPLYAPLPYANAKPEFLWLDERLTANGLPVTLATLPQGEPLSGNGLARIEVKKEAARFSISVSRTLHQLDAVEPKKCLSSTLVL